MSVKKDPHGRNRDLQVQTTCLAVLEKVRKTRKPVLVTKFGKPVAQVLPPPPEAPREDAGLGAMHGTAWAVGDIVSPAAAEDEWEVLRG